MGFRVEGLELRLAGSRAVVQLVGFTMGVYF